MKCDLAWLSEWVTELPPAEELARGLTLAGLEVDDHRDQVLELELTPNRGDCLSIRGLAREVSALTAAGLQEPFDLGEAPDPSAGKPELGTIDADACPYYSLRRIEGIDPQAKTPPWILDRLERSGVRAHHLLVDVTNYVMLELGQPLHAFDADAVSGAVSVRWAQEKETIRTLDEAQLELDPDMLVIAADGQPIAVAGIIGGAASAVGEQTTRVFLESAHFAPEAIAGRARRLKLHTESSRRFERGVDPRLPLQATQRATELILEHAGGQVSEVVHAGQQAPEYRPHRIRLRASRLAKCLALEVDGAEVVRILQALGCRVGQGSGQWEVSAPSWRFDLAIEEDLIEEVARVYGYDRIEPAPVPLPGAWEVPPQPWARQLEHCRSRLVACGYSEAVTYSFTEEKLEQLFAPESRPWCLLNPISEDQAVMRSTLIPSLLRVAQYNLNRQQAGVRLFETAKVFARNGEEARETWVLGGVACGMAHPLQWGATMRPVDFYDVKGDVQNLLRGGSGSLEFSPADHSALHPGQTADISLGGKKIGILGALHPGLHDTFDFSGPAIAFELELEAWREFPAPHFSPWPEYPAVMRDLNVVVTEDTPASAVEACVQSLGIESLRETAVFDVYRGKGLEAGTKSLALHLIFQSFSGTLKDREVDGHLERVIAQLEELLGAETRQWAKP